MASINQIWLQISQEQKYNFRENEAKLLTLQNMVQELLRIQVDENLGALGNLEQAKKELSGEAPDDGDLDSDCSGEFDEEQKTQKEDDYETLGRLLLQQVQFSTAFLLDRLTKIVERYQNCLDLKFNNGVNTLDLQATGITAERQLAYVVAVTNALFGICGLPSAQSKLEKKIVPAGQEKIIKVGELQVAIMVKYDDLSLMGKIIQFISITNQLKQRDNGVQFDTNLEVRLLDFMQMFKRQIIGDPRMILFGTNQFEDQKQQQSGNAEMAYPSKEYSEKISNELS